MDNDPQGMIPALEDLKGVLVHSPGPPRSNPHSRGSELLGSRLCKDQTPTQQHRGSHKGHLKVRFEGDVMVQLGEAMTNDLESPRAPRPGEYLERGIPRGCTRAQS